MYQSSFPRRSAPSVPSRAVAFDAGTLAYLRKDYAFFFGGIVSAAAGAMTALYAGAGTSQLVIGEAGPMRGLRVPPLVGWFTQHWILAIILYFGAFFGMSAARRIPRVNALALFGFTFVTGLFIAPVLFVAGALGSAGAAMTSNPVRDAFLLAIAEFGGLTAYVFVTRKDFSFLGGFLTMGIVVLLVAMLIGMFVGGQVLQLGIASVGVILFGAYVLYDTSRLLRSDDRTDPVSAAAGLFLNFLNIFMFILRILMSGSRRN
jgi:modulator of FtsH protease